jgi:hypothetical protein
MKKDYCWRCKKHIVLVETSDRSKFGDLYCDAVQAVKTHRERTGASLKFAAKIFERRSHLFVQSAAIDLTN